MNTLQTLKKNVKEAYQELSGKAVSKARLVLNLKDIDKGKHLRKQGDPIKPTRVGLRTLTKARMVFFSDGSVRHMDPHVTGKQARRLARRAKHQARMARKRG